MVATFPIVIEDMSLDDIDGVQEVEVCVHKPDAPITVPFDDVTVTITRSRV